MTAPAGPKTAGNMASWRMAATGWCGAWPGCGTGWTPGTAGSPCGTWSSPMARTLLPKPGNAWPGKVLRHFVLFGFEVLERPPCSYPPEGDHPRGGAPGRSSEPRPGAIAIVAHAGNWEYTVTGYGLQYRPVAGGGPGPGPPSGPGPVARRLRQRGGNWIGRPSRRA